MSGNMVLDVAVSELIQGNCEEFRRLLAEYAETHASHYTVSAELPPIPIILSRCLKCFDSYYTYIDVYVEADTQSQMNGFFFGQEHSIYIESKNIDEVLKLISALSTNTLLCIPYKPKVSAKEFAEALEKKQSCSELQITDTRLTGLLARFEGYVKIGHTQFKFISTFAKKTRIDLQAISRVYRELMVLEPIIRVILSVVQW